MCEFFIFDRGIAVPSDAFCGTRELSFVYAPMAIGTQGDQVVR